MIDQQFLIGQRVLVGNAIGYYVCPDTAGKYGNPLTGKPELVDPQPFMIDRCWVYVPHRGYACNYYRHNVYPLPGGQL